MNPRRIAVIPGDGIGPEITQATLKLLAAVGFDPEWVYLDAGLAAIQMGKPAMPQETIDAVRELGCALKGPTTTPSGGGHSSANVALRRALDLYANVRPARSLPGVRGPFSEKDLDLVIVRENTEGLYSGIEFMPHPDIAQAVKVITRPGCQRLVEYAFRMAEREGRNPVTAVHKANIMKMTDGMFLEVFYEIAKRHPDIQANDIIVDNCCLQLVTRPERFNVLVAENLYGDIVSDLCAGLVGGLGLAPGANIGDDCAVFEAVHGSAPDIAGQGLANPTALILSAALMLRHLGLNEQAQLITDAVTQACAERKVLTRDLGGDATTAEFTDNLIRICSERMAART
jgi:isopropylmalate/isohomocitrate dehydrogenase-like protein